MDVDDALDIGPGGVDGRVESEASLVHPQVGASPVHYLPLHVDLDLDTHTHTRAEYTVRRQDGDGRKKRRGTAEEKRRGAEQRVSLTRLEADTSLYRRPKGTIRNLSSSEFTLTWVAQSHNAHACEST